MLALIFIYLFFQILEEIEKHGIKIYEFPDCDSDEDDEFKKQDLELKVWYFTLSMLGLLSSKAQGCKDFW